MTKATKANQFCVSPSPWKATCWTFVLGRCPKGCWRSGGVRLHCLEHDLIWFNDIYYVATFLFCLWTWLFSYCKILYSGLMLGERRAVSKCRPLHMGRAEGYENHRFPWALVQRSEVCCQLPHNLQRQTMLLLSNIQLDVTVHSVLYNHVQSTSSRLKHQRCNGAWAVKS